MSLLVQQTKHYLRPGKQKCIYRKRCTIFSKMARRFQEADWCKHTNKLSNSWRRLLDSARKERDNLCRNSSNQEQRPFLSVSCENRKVKEHWGGGTSHHTTRLVLPATNFTSVFPKLGYAGINNRIDHLIIQGKLSFRWFPQRE
jgi:hypothetical protein